MNRLNIFSGMSFLMVLMLFICQKDIVRDPVQKIIEPATLTVTTDSIIQPFSAREGDHRSVFLTSNSSWQIESFPGWVTVSPLSGNGNAHVNISVQANTGPQRMGTITLSSKDGSQTVSMKIIQVSATGAQTETQMIYYLSPSGNDMNPGTITQPFYSLGKLSRVIQPGQTAYMRGGRYNFSSQSQLDLTGLCGAPGNMIQIFNYPGETPVINPGPLYPSGKWGINFYNTNYVHLKGLEITGFVQPKSGGNVMGLWCWGNSNYNIFELINYHNNGFPLIIQTNWPNSISGHGTGNQIINCDFHHNYDPYTGDSAGAYGNADGLNVLTPPNTITLVSGCRCWNNSDDNYDYYGADGTVNTVNCWAWNSGYREDGVTTGGDGNGFKEGGYIAGHDQSTIVTRTFINCLCFDNRLIGFDQNDQQSIMNFYNNTSYNNGNNGFDFYQQIAPAHQINFVCRNNISFSNHNKNEANEYPLVSSNNTWDPGCSVSKNDFISVDTTGVSGPRQPDGSLPELNFLKLAPTSPLKTGGVDLGLGYGKVMGFTY